MPPALHCVQSGSGPGLVLLHPVGLDHAMWGALPARCAETRRVLAVDLRGHGRSPPAETGLGLGDYADDVRRAMERHGLGPSVVLGLSFGGMIAQEFALRHPDLVSGLVLCGCPGTMAPDARPVLRERGLAAERGGMQAVVDATIERWFTPPFRSEPVVADVRRRLLTDEVAGWSAAWHAIAGLGDLARLSAIRAPTLVVSGGRDAATPVAASTALAQAIPGARLEVLPEAAHMMQFEGGEAFGHAVTGFLGDLAQ